MSEIHFHFMYGLNGLYIPDTNETCISVEDAIETATQFVERYLDDIADQPDDEPVNMTEDWTYAMERDYLEEEIKDLQEKYSTTEIAKLGWSINMRGNYDLLQIAECSETACLDEVAYD